VTCAAIPQKQVIYFNLL